MMSAADQFASSLVAKAVMARRMRLVRPRGGSVDEAEADGAFELTRIGSAVTGQLRARRRRQPALRLYPAKSSHALAAVKYANAVEKLGSVRGIDFDADKGSAAKSDGGAVARCAEATFIRSVHERLRQGVLLPLSRGEVPITQGLILNLAVLHAVSISDLCRVAGWSDQNKRARKMIRDHLEVALDVVSETSIE